MRMKEFFKKKFINCWLNSWRNAGCWWCRYIFLFQEKWINQIWECNCEKWQNSSYKYQFNFLSNFFKYSILTKKTRIDLNNSRIWFSEKVSKRLKKYQNYLIILFNLIRLLIHYQDYCLDFAHFKVHFHSVHHFVQWEFVFAVAESGYYFAGKAGLDATGFGS